MPAEDFAVIILSAGFSSRMAAFKPLLKLGESTVLETSVGIFRNAGILNTKIVIGYRAEDLKTVLDRLNVDWVLNENYSEGMFSSVIAGLRSMSADVKAAFMMPVDIPLVRSSSIMKMAEAYLKWGPQIIYPTFRKKRGHPPLIPSYLFPEIISWKGTDGLKSFLQLHESEAAEIEVSDEGILLDIDTPEDYEKVCGLYER